MQIAITLCLVWQNYTLCFKGPYLSTSSGIMCPLVYLFMFFFSRSMAFTSLLCGRAPINRSEISTFFQFGISIKKTNLCQYLSTNSAIVKSFLN